MTDHQVHRHHADDPGGHDRPGETVIRVWNRRTVYNGDGDEQHFILKVEGGHGGVDPVIMEEFLRFAREGDVTEISQVAAGYRATHLLRNRGIPCDIPPLDEKLITYFQQQP